MLPANTKTTLTWILKDEVSGPARGISGALGGLISPVGLAVAGIGALAGGLALAASAAADEEVNIKKLDAALAASVPGWDGNTDAIEEMISARENLAFSDDELRNSMALLVTATGSVEEASNLQATAMDLARLKGVSLETATIALAKASEGSTRELKALGLSVDDSATSAENLATIAAAAAGQAEGYASTTQAKWETLQNKFGNVVETVGTALLPILSDLADFAIETLIPAIEDFAELVGPILQEAIEFLGPIISDFIDQYVKPALKVIQDLIAFITEAIDFLGDLSIGLQQSGLFTPTRLPGRAAGGPVEAGEAYIVGEEGPELLLMGNASGTVIPGGSSSGSMVPVEIPVYLDGREIARITDERLYLMLQRSAPVMGRA